jgi:signal transduction histidine kinase
MTVCFIFVATVPLTITAVYTTRRHLAVVRSVAARAVRNNTLAVAEWPILESYFQSRDAHDEVGFWTPKLEVQLRTFMELNPLYGRIMVADGTGRTLMKVVRQGTTTSMIRRAAVPASEPAASVSEPPWPREWYERASSLLPRQATVHVLADDTLGPVAVCAAPVPRTAALGRAIVLLHADLDRALEPADGRWAGRLAIFDSGGRVVYDAGPNEPALDHVPALGQSIDGSNRLISTATLAVAAGVVDESWTLAIAEPAGSLEAEVAAYRRAYLNVLIASMLVAVLLGVGIARQFTRPVRRLYDATQRIGRGDFDVALTDDAGDEVGALTSQVQVMASQLREAHGSFERRLREKTEELLQSERLATIGRTAAAVAHEINNPSGIIALYAQMLIERLPADDPSASKLRVVSEKSQEISRVVRELLDYARKPEPVKAWVETEPLLRDAMNAAFCVTDGKTSAGRLHSQLRVDEGAARLYVDPHQVSRMVRNLVTNALHAMPDGGALALQCAREDGGWVTIDVTDTGTGISEDQQRHLFDAFYSTKRFGAGTGLGLAISKEIVERHGGSITVWSAPGRGTTVKVRLPNGEEGNDS